MDEMSLSKPDCLFDPAQVATCSSDPGRHIRSFLSSKYGLSLTLGDDECVCNVGGVVDTEADAEDDVDAGDGVDGEAPEVDHARDVDQGEEDAGQDLHADRAGEEGSIKAASDVA